MPPADWPSNVDWVVTTPFTAAGHLNVGDGFDFVGQGLLTGTVNRVVDVDNSPVLRYTFSVPEPPTLLLVVASFGTLVVLFSARVLRDRRHRNRLLAAH